MVGLKHEQFVDDLMFLVESGEVPMARIDDAVERILRVKFVAGLFEYPFADRSLIDLVGCKVNILFMVCFTLLTYLGTWVFMSLYIYLFHYNIHDSSISTFISFSCILVLLFMYFSLAKPILFGINPLNI